jgi:hypothetical protein
MSLQRGLFKQEPLVAKILCVIARFTASLIAKIQPESTSLIPKFTPHQTWRCHISHQLALQPIQLTPTGVKSLLQLVQARRTPQAIAKRAQIVVSASAHPDWSSRQLAQSLRLDARLIRKWRRRWQETLSLQDAPRSGGPRRFSSEVRTQVTGSSAETVLSHSKYPAKSVRRTAWSDFPPERCPRRSERLSARLPVLVPFALLYC